MTVRALLRHRPTGTFARVLVVAAAAVVVAAGLLVGLAVASGAGTYPLTAVFSQAPGLFPGNAVQVLGVPVGSVTSVRPVDATVVVTMAVHDSQRVPADAVASLVSPELLGEPDIDLGPGYTSGPALAPGAVIPESRTRVPISTDQLLKSLQQNLSALNPNGVHGLITNLAQDLDGQGQGLNRLLAGAAGTLQLLADKGDDLGRLDGTLAQLTGTLDSRTSEISQLLTDYDTVSAVLAEHSTQLGDGLTQFSQASTELVDLLDPNLLPLQSDVGTVTTVGRTLDRNLGNLDQVLTSVNALFQAAQRAYDPTHQWLNLNLQLPVGVTGAYVAGLIRDRLAGVCRRLAANHAQGLSATQLATLAECGNPSSGYFDPIIDDVPGILDALSQGTTPPAATPASLFAQGLSTIPGASGTSPSATPSTAPSTSPTSSSPSAPPSSTTTTTTTPPTSTCTGLLSVLGCSTGSGGSGSGSGGSGSGSGGSGSGSSGGLGGLLADRQPLGSAAPSLAAPAAALLGPLPPSAPGGAPAPARSHRHPHAHRRGDRR